MTYNSFPTWKSSPSYDYFEPIRPTSTVTILGWIDGNTFGFVFCLEYLVVRSYQNLNLAFNVTDVYKILIVIKTTFPNTIFFR